MKSGPDSTNLNELPAVWLISSCSASNRSSAYLGEKVVREKEYLSAMRTIGYSSAFSRNVIEEIQEEIGDG